MMDIQASINYIEGNIRTLEGEIYTFEKMALPRLATDKELLESMRGDVIKMEALLAKKKSGEEITADEIKEAVPAAFR